ncbi:MAG TPA: ABC transporter permease [Dongiaceae bacterium]|jgi:ABC-2 type transport system permease protein|nr:ABC transporter permease [Dongiaceae bacterium]
MTRFSLHRFLAVCAKEFIQMRRDRISFGVMFGIPIMQLLIFGYAINTDPKNLPAVAVTAENTIFVRSLLQSIEKTGYLRFIGPPVSDAEADRLLKAGDVQFAISIPPHFSADLVRGLHPTVTAEVDASDPVASANALAALGGLFTTALAHDLTGPPARLPTSPPPIEVRIHRRYNEEGITQYNVVPGLIGVVLTLTMVVQTALAMAREMERGTMENLLAMPVRPAEVMLGKIVPFVLIGYVQIAIIVLAARFLFHVPLEGSVGLLSFCALFFIAANLAMGFTFSTMARNQLQATQMSTFFFLPSMMLSGFIFPFRGMPLWAQYIGQVIPLTHFIRIVRGILLKGNTFALVWPELWPIILFMLGAMALALFRYRRTLD